MNILLNGLGCPDGGGSLLLKELLQTVPPYIKLTSLIPNNKFFSKLVFESNVFPVFTNMSLVSKVINRPLAEIKYNIQMLLKKYDAIINFSSYGLCFTQNQLLYIHNPYLLDLNVPKRIGHGYPNILNRFALFTSIRNAKIIFVQSEHMLKSLYKYCDIKGYQRPTKTMILKPLPIVNNDFSDIQKKYDFQLFYPSSDFLHKRVELAISSSLLARNFDSEIGLVITTEETIDDNGIKFCGQIKSAEVLAYLKSSDALLFTSERETLGLPLLESLYLELPAILPDLPYAREIYGDAALYFKYSTPECVADSIKTLKMNYTYFKIKAIERKKNEWKKRFTLEEHWNIFMNNLTK